jgi:hypothetical protein
MFCLKVVIAHPDWKRPCVDIIVEHYKNKEDAEKRLNKIKLQYIEDFNLTTDILNSSDNQNLISIEDLDKIIENGLLSDYIYQDSYMSHVPFECEIYQVII